MKLEEVLIGSKNINCKDLSEKYKVMGILLNNGCVPFSICTNDMTIATYGDRQFTTLKSDATVKTNIPASDFIKANS